MSFWSKLKEKSITFSGFLRLVVLLCSIVLIGCISYDTFLFSNPFAQSEFTQKVQFWVCIFFMLDIVLEFVVTKHKSRYLLAYFLLFIACIPWITVLPMIPNLRIPDDVLYMLRFMPLIRSCYALAIVVGWFTFRRSSALFMTYMVSLLSGIYVGSLAFYVCEVNVNPLVKTYWDALWWAGMEAITVGCNIEAVTPIGKILSVIVAVLGLLIIPMFTVYVSNIVGLFQTMSKTAAEDGDTSSKRADSTEKH